MPADSDVGDSPAAEAKSFVQLREEYNQASEQLAHIDGLISRYEAASDDDPDMRAKIVELREDFALKAAEAQELKERAYGKDSRERARADFEKLPLPGTSKGIGRISEPDLYERGGRSFFADLYAAQTKNDPSSMERINKHQRFMAEQRAVATATLGGIVPPQYLVDLYAKASRNGRVYADQANRQPLPDVGMSIVVPRLTQGTAAGVQSSENTAVTTQDPTEADLTLTLTTIAGYSPVSRQTLDRAAYSDQILFEDLIARYWAALDTQCINGSGTATIQGVWPKIADVTQQINTAFGGLGYVPDKVFMHPRRWGWFTAALDTQNRPLLPITGAGVNTIGTGDASQYGLVGNMMGLNVYTDANIPTNLGAGTNEDRIIVECSQVVHLFERDSDPVTLSFEQQAGTSLQVQLVVYGYAAFTAGRYPAASGIVSGAGLVPPTF